MKYCKKLPICLVWYWRGEVFWQTTVRASICWSDWVTACLHYCSRLGACIAFTCLSDLNRLLIQAISLISLTQAPSLLTQVQYSAQSCVNYHTMLEGTTIFFKKLCNSLEYRLILHRKTLVLQIKCQISQLLFNQCCLKNFTNNVLGYVHEFMYDLSWKNGGWVGFRGN